MFDLILYAIVIALWIIIFAFMLGLFFSVLGIASIIGIPVGVFYGIKNYILSITENINNKILKIAMIIITSVIITLIFAYIVAILYYISNY